METKRIYIGNLDPSVDEYAVIKLFEPFGKIVVFDYMFFLHGPKKGQPRGYCFLEYEKKPEAMTAISALNGKRIKGRPLVVSSANKNTLPSTEDGGGGKHHRSLMHKPTSFGLLRNQKMTQSKSTDAKILAIEQKLAALQKSKPSSSTTTTQSSTTTQTDTPSILASSSSSSSSSSPSPLPPPSTQNRRFRPY